LVFGALPKKLYNNSLGIWCAILITHWKEGSAHKTPYNYDTHVPLIVFHPGKFEKRYVRQRVSPM